MLLRSKLYNGLEKIIPYLSNPRQFHLGCSSNFWRKPKPLRKKHEGKFRLVEPFDFEERKQNLIDKNRADDLLYNPLEDYNIMKYNSENGRIYDNKPFKIKVVEGRVYYWCNCGYSKSQPFCDGTHKDERYRIKLKPFKFLAPKTQEYWFCNCKQSSKKPFCDGTHKRQDIQDAIK